MGPRRRGTQLHEPGILRLRFGKLPGQGEVKSEERTGQRIDWVQCDSLAIKRDAPRRVPFRYGKGARVGEERRVRGSQCQSSPQRFACSLPVKVEIELDVRAGAQCFRQVGLERQRARRSLSCAGQMGVEACPSHLGGKVAVPHMRLGQARPSERESGVEFHRPLILDQRLARAFFRVTIRVKPALQIMLVGLHIFRPAFFRRLHLCLNRRLGRRIRGAIRELTAQLSHDSLGELGLHGEHVLQITRVVFRPELLARLGLSKPGRDAHDVAGLAHTPLNQMRDAEFLPDLLRGRIFAFERNV